MTPAAEPWATSTLTHFGLPITSPGPSALKAILEGASRLHQHIYDTRLATARRRAQRHRHGCQLSERDGFSPSETSTVPANSNSTSTMRAAGPWATSTPTHCGLPIPVAETLRAQGDLEGARRLHQHVYDTRRATLGDEHNDTVTAASYLGVTVFSLGDLDGARPLEQHVYDARRATRGAEHNDTLTAADNLAATLYALGDHDGARHLQQLVYDTRRRTLGDEHPDTLRAAHGLAETLRAQGDFEGASRLHQHIYDTRRSTLGDEHNDTLTAGGYLGVTLFSLGDLDGARRLEQHVYDASRVTLGDEHPDTLIDTYNLAETLRAQGKLAGAQHLHRRGVRGPPSGLLGADNPASFVCRHPCGSQWSSHRRRGVESLTGALARCARYIVDLFVILDRPAAAQSDRSPADYTFLWYDATAKGPDEEGTNGPGLMRYVNGGARYVGHGGRPGRC